MPSLERNSQATSFSSQSGVGECNSKKNWLNQIPNYSYHLDAVPSATPVSHYKVVTKKGEELCYNVSYTEIIPTC